MSSSLLILLTIIHPDLGMNGPQETLRFDPLRTVQGIMTGIGFLGAGVILKEGANIIGLTTAASIWMTAAIGIVIGSGFYFAALLAAALTLIALIVFRWIEAAFPVHRFGNLKVRLLRTSPLGEKEIMGILEEQKARTSRSGYHLEEGGEIIVYEMMVHFRARDGFRKLAEVLRDLEGISDFNLRLTSR
jgi:putative Mg2+ transporter-C (MgtC) family protein